MIRYPIDHRPDEQRFQTIVDDQLCVLDYRELPGVLQLTHTGVPDAVAGRGIAAELVKAALDHARAHGLKIEPRCSYVRVYLRRHPENQDLLAPAP